jgi:hypothetical protein
MSDTTAMPGTVQAQQDDIVNMQKLKLGNSNLEVLRPQSVKSRQPSSDAESPQIPRSGDCSGISPTSDNLLPVALDVTRKEQNEGTALLPKIAVVFTVSGPLVYQERGRSVSIREAGFGHALIVDWDYTAR